MGLLDLNGLGHYLFWAKGPVCRAFLAPFSRPCRLHLCLTTIFVICKDIFDSLFNNICTYFGFMNYISSALFSKLSDFICCKDLKHNPALHNGKTITPLWSFLDYAPQLCFFLLSVSFGGVRY